MAAFKMHVHRGLKAYYVSKGRKWVVEEGDIKHEFNNVNEAVKRFPELMEVTPIVMACERKKETKREVVLVPSKTEDSKKILSKSVSCYYCSGKGELFSGIICTNCKGQGVFEVNTRGLG